MNGLEDEYGTQLEFIRLNAAEPDNVIIQQGYGLRGHPTVAILDTDGNADAKFIGEQSAETLRNAIDLMLNGN
ncbi:MAG: TlpA family protein disulfide reductase [Candidatus Promineifilaceae bacterium]